MERQYLIFSAGESDNSPDNPILCNVAEEGGRSQCCVLRPLEDGQPPIQYLANGGGGCSGIVTISGGGSDHNFPLDYNLRTPEEINRGYPDPDRYAKERSEQLLRRAMRELEQEEWKLAIAKRKEQRKRIRYIAIISSCVLLFGIILLLCFQL